MKLAILRADTRTNYRVLFRKHAVRLDAVPDADYFFFCVRDPIARYLSGFLSRQREGQPRYNIPWNEDEATAFAQFESPDALAISLTAGGSEQQQAEDAMCAIRHVRTSYWDWFRDPDYFKSRAHRVLWVGHQESLDLGPLAQTFGVESLQLPTDPVKANRSPQQKPDLSDLAQANLRDWYAKDYEFLDLCQELLPRWAESP